MKNILSLMLACLALPAAAQTKKPAPKPKAAPAVKTASATEKQLVTTMCDCFAKDTASIKTEAQLMGFFNKCLSEDEKAASLFLKYIKEKGGDMTDQASMQTIGEGLGKKMAGDCPPFFRAVLRAQQSKMSVE